MHENPYIPLGVLVRDCANPPFGENNPLAPRVGECNQANTPEASIPSAVELFPKSLAKLEGVRGAVAPAAAASLLGVRGVKNIPHGDNKSALAMSGNGLREGAGAAAPPSPFSGRGELCFLILADDLRGDILAAKN